MIFELLITFFKIGLLSIGGGYAIIPLIQEQVVIHQAWITPKTFTDIITISQMTPGPLAVNTSTFVGMQIGGMSGAIVATIGCVISGVIISALLYEFFKRFKQSLYISEILKGLKATSLGLICSAGFTIILLTFFGSSDYSMFKSFDFIALGLFAISLFCLRKYKVNPILMMSLAGLAGLIVYI